MCSTDKAPAVISFQHTVKTLLCLVCVSQMWDWNAVKGYFGFFLQGTRVQ